MNKAIGMVEYSTVSSGMQAADVIVKTADVEILQADTVSRYAQQLQQHCRYGTPASVNAKDLLTYTFLLFEHITLLSAYRKRMTTHLLLPPKLHFPIPRCMS